MGVCNSNSISKNQIEEPRSVLARQSSNFERDLEEMLNNKECQELKACGKLENMDEECFICALQYSRFQEITLSCKHKFHRNCIDHWLDKSPTCPICRALNKKHNI